jgi:hypothetical protein
LKTLLQCDCMTGSFGSGWDNVKGSKYRLMPFRNIPPKYSVLLCSWCNTDKNHGAFIGMHMAKGSHSKKPLNGT